METLQAWGPVIRNYAVFSLVAVAGYLFYGNKGKTKSSKSIERLDSTDARRRVAKQNGRAKIRISKDIEISPASDGVDILELSPAASSASSSTSKKRKSKSGPSPVAVPVTPNITVRGSHNSEMDEEYDVGEYARQLDAVQKGVVLDKTTGPGHVGIKRNSGPAFRFANGLELQSAQSPGDSATHEAGDISDMLPQPTARTSTIRVTGQQPTSKTRVTQQTQNSKETKRQRQNRRKAEEQKLRRIEDENQRQVLLEQQRRAAREARGEPMKNGVATRKSPHNAWSSSLQAGRSRDNTESQMDPVRANMHVRMLDTSDQDAVSNTSSTDLPTSATTPTTNTSFYGVDSTYESGSQVLLEQEGDWNEVLNRKNAKRKVPDIPPPLQRASRRSVEHATTVPSVPTGDISPKNLETSVSSSTASRVRLQDSGPAPAPTTRLHTLHRDTYSAPRAIRHPDDSDWTA